MFYKVFLPQKLFLKIFFTRFTLLRVLILLLLLVLKCQIFKMSHFQTSLFLASFKPTFRQCQRQRFRNEDILQQKTTRLSVGRSVGRSFNDVSLHTEKNKSFAAARRMIKAQEIKERERERDRKSVCRVCRVSCVRDRERGSYLNATFERESRGASIIKLICRN